MIAHKSVPDGGLEHAAYPAARITRAEKFLTLTDSDTGLSPSPERDIDCYLCARMRIYSRH